MLADGLPHHDLVETPNGYRNQPVVDDLVVPYFSDTADHPGHLRGAANLLHLGADEDPNTRVFADKTAHHADKYKQFRCDRRRQVHADVTVA